MCYNDLDALLRKIPEELTMIALTLTNIKKFMSQLLRSEIFDNFWFIEGEIVTFNTFSINGAIHKSFFDSDEETEEYSYWKEVKDYCYFLIRGKRTPLSFRLVFSLSRHNMERTIQKSTPSIAPDSVQGLYLNIRFDGTRLTCVTGTSFKTFSMDRSLEHAWDDMARKFLLQKGIEFEEE